MMKHFLKQFFMFFAEEKVAGFPSHVGGGFFSCGLGDRVLPSLVIVASSAVRACVHVCERDRDRDLR
jgi:presenilin-like A22 family membrane protease